MNKRLLSGLLFLSLLLSCTKDDLNDDNSQFSNGYDTIKLISEEKINEYITKQLEENGDVDWTHAPSEILWSAAVRGEGVLSIGYHINKQEDIQNAKNNNFFEARSNIISTITSTEGIAKSQSLLTDDTTLHYIEMNVSKLETVIALQKQNDIRYIEPSGYAIENTQRFSKSSNGALGCEKNSSNLNNDDFTVIAPNALLPWNFKYHKITEAWKYSTGKGITVGLIDTGISPLQSLLNERFNTGSSTARSIHFFNTYGNGFNDECGHGTAMASTIVAPRNNERMPVGVAYNANLISYKGTSDVLLNSRKERRSVSQAIRELADRDDVKIISISLGYVWSIGNIKDAIKYAYQRNKLIIAAGGTSTSFTRWYGVIFPASMKETIAVTGIKDGGYDACDTCHNGKKIDFTIVMQRSNNASRNVPVLGFNDGNRDYISGSSVATAMTAGIAALVWSKNPSLTRAEVIQKLQKSAEFYPKRDRNYGYGNIDALKAVK